MKSNISTFIASSNLFSGFKVNIDLNYCDSFQDIINIFNKELEYILTKNNFEILLEKFKLLNFHIHSFTFEDILISKSDKVFYICECNSPTNINLKID